MTEHTAISSPLIATYGDSSGDYAAMLTPGGTGFWQSPDGTVVATWRDCTDAEQTAIHYVGDDDATAYIEMRGAIVGPEDVLVFGAVTDYGIEAGDLVIASPRLERMVLVTIQHYTADDLAWLRACIIANGIDPADVDMPAVMDIAFEIVTDMSDGETGYAVRDGVDLDAVIARFTRG